MLRSRSGAASSGLLACGLTLALVGPLAPGAAAADSCAVFFDVNKDRHDDLAIGTPAEDVDGAKDAGTVTIVYGDDAGTFGPNDGRSLSQEDLGLRSESGDRFGATLLTSDLNGDQCADLVIGAPGENDGAGAVVIVFGKAPGTGAFGSSVQVLKQGADGTPGSAEDGDGFGATFAVRGTAVHGGAGELWVGVPGEDLGQAGNAGVVAVFPTGTGLLPQAGRTQVKQGTGGVPNSVEAGDRFGAALSGAGDTVLVGVPREDLGAVKDAGLVAAFDGTTWSTVSQDTAGVPGSAENGDRFGSAVSVYPGCQDGTWAWALSAPYEDVGGGSDAGNVTVLDRGTGTAIVVRLGGAGLPGSASDGDRFGTAVAGSGRSEGRPLPALAVGAPYDDVGAAGNAGTVLVVRTDCPGGVLGVSEATLVDQDTGAVPEVAQAGDRFGSAVGVASVLVGVPATGDLAWRLVVGAPGENESTTGGTFVDSGLVTVLPESTEGYTDVGSTAFGQETPAMPGTGEQADGFGAAVAALGR